MLKKTKQTRNPKDSFDSGKISAAKKRHKNVRGIKREMFSWLKQKRPLQICMGTCFLQEVTKEAKRAKLQNTKIEQDIIEQAKAERNVIKILILGSAESGKSTVVKQIKIIYSQGFSKQELISFKSAVLDNLLTSMKIVLHGMGALRINLANKKNKDHAQSILSCNQCVGEDQELLPFVAHAFCALWADHGVRTAAARGFEFELNDSALYFFENMSRILAPNYIPIEMDVLRVRLRTSSVIETQFQIGGTIFRLYDVGGQRSERRKWLSCFDCSNALLFVVALSSYDLVLQEDPAVNRLLESLDLFSSICTNKLFRKATRVLLMNKTDLFRKKILNSGRHLRFHLPTYKGADCDVDAAARYVAAMFSACCSRTGSPVYLHFTTATETADIRVVFHMTIDQIIQKNLAAVELL